MEMSGGAHHPAEFTLAWLTHAPVRCCSASGFVLRYDSVRGTQPKSKENVIILVS